MKKSLRITREQTELTPEQLVEAEKYANEQIKKFLSTEKTNRREVEKYAINAYKISGTKLPKKIRWFKSPEAMCAYKADSVGNSVGSSVESSVWSSVRSSVESSVRSSVWNSVWSSVWNSVWSSVESSVWSSVWSSVRSSVESSVWSSVRSSVESSVRSSVWNSVWSYYNADGWSFYGFFHKYFEKNKIVWLLKLSENVTGCAFYENECWLVEHPKTLDRDESGKLHSITGKAIEWRDGVGYYLIHGIRFDEKLWKKVTGKQTRIETILTIENMEQRMVALKLVGVERLFKTANSKLIDKSKRGNELYLLKDIFQTDAYYLKYSCPSTGRVYASGIDPEVGKLGSADGCMAWKFSMTEAEYQNMKIEA
jgi:hypothetical protein